MKPTLGNTDRVLTWHTAALILGEELSTVGPNFYYDFTPKQWLAWALAQVKK